MKMQLLIKVENAGDNRRTLLGNEPPRSNDAPRNGLTSMVLCLHSQLLLFACLDQCNPCYGDGRIGWLPNSALAAESSLLGIGSPRHSIPEAIVGFDIPE